MSFNNVYNIYIAIHFFDSKEIENHMGEDMKTTRENRVFKHYVLLTLLILVMCFTTGCATSRISRGEVMTYVENNLGIENYSIEWFRHSNKYSKYAYTVYDKDADLEFDVYGVVGLTGDIILSFTRDISDDYVLKYLEKINGSLPNTFKYYGKGDNREIISFYGGYIITYSNRAELDEACEKLWMINNALEEKHKYSIPFIFRYVDPDFTTQDSLMKYVIDSSFCDYSGHIFKEKSDDDKYVQSLSQLKEEVESKYFTLGYVYNNPDILADLGDEDIEDFIDYGPVDVYIVDDIDMVSDDIEENPSNIEEYARLSDGCVAYKSERRNYRITYGNLYTLLVNEGFDVSGDSEDFIVTIPDGSQYEFAKTFIDTNKLNWRSYYMCDGEKVYTDLDEDISVSKALISELFGLYIEFEP